MFQNQKSCIFKIDGQMYKISLIDSCGFSATSHGEINKTDVYYHDRLQEECRFVPIEGGLFCEKTFGNISDYTCGCGIMGYSINRHETQMKELSPEEKLLRAIFGEKEKETLDTHRILAHYDSNCKICGQPIIPMSQRLKRP